MGGGREPRGACTLVGSDPLRSRSTWWGGLVVVRGRCALLAASAVCVCARDSNTSIEKKIYS